MMRVILATCACVGALLAEAAHAEIRITEWMYNGLGAGNAGEFIELTNFGISPVNMTGWSFDDDSDTAGTVSLSGFGTVAPFESVILTDLTEAEFRTVWGLAPTVKVIGGNTTNLGRNDDINIFNSSGVLIDQLEFGDQDFPGSIRTQNVSGNPVNFAALGANNPALWQLSFLGDAYGSYQSSALNGAELGNPGRFPIPEPTSAALALVMGGALLSTIRRKR